MVTTCNCDIDSKAYIVTMVTMIVMICKRGTQLHVQFVTMVTS